MDFLAVVPLNAMHRFLSWKSYAILMTDLIKELENPTIETNVGLFIHDIELINIPKKITSKNLDICYVHERGKEMANDFLVIYDNESFTKDRIQYYLMNGLQSLVTDKVIDIYKNMTNDVDLENGKIDNALDFLNNLNKNKN